MTSGVEYRVLGTLEVSRDGRPVALGGPKQRRLLALLLFQAGRPVSIDALVEDLWGNNPPATAIKTVHKYVSDLRKKLGAEKPLSTEASGYVLAVAKKQLDVDRFEQLIDHASRTIESDRAAALFDEALGLWRGRPWSDLDDVESVGPERARLQERRQGALEDLMEAELALGHHRQIVGRLEEMVVEHPLRERRWSQLMLALYRSDRQAEALAAYQRVRTTLTDQLGIEPSSELRELQSRILVQDPDLDSAPVAVDIHPGPRPNNLPLQLTRFVGRRRELAHALELLETTRLLTFTGVGGSGKTRLALELGEGRREDYAGGVWFAALETVVEPERIQKVIATTLGAREQPGSTLDEVLVDVVRSKQMLLILDNCEHVVESCALVVDTLLRSCPNLRILATSRERLGVGGEIVWQVPPMPVPQTEHLPVESLRQHEAIELFVDRAAAALPGFELTAGNAEAVARICRQVDGIPLALELAASRVASLDVDEIAGRLSDCFRMLGPGDRTAPARQQTLRSALDWSYELLSEKERMLFDRLSVFVGGFTLEAVEEVGAGGAIEPGEAPYLLSQLVDKSLVVRGHGRYQLLETIRHYGREKLKASAAAGDVRARHANYFLTLAQSAQPELRGPKQALWLGRLEAECDNFSTVLNHTSGQEELCLRLAGALWEFWMFLHPSEGFGCMENALLQSAGVEPSLRAPALVAAGWLALEQANTERATAWGREALDMYQALGDRSGVAACTHLMGWVSEYRGDYEHSAKLLEDSAAEYERLGEEWHMARALHHLGMVRRLQGDYEQAKALHQKSLAIFRRAGDRMRVAFSLWNLGVVARYQGDYPAATAYCEQSLEIMQEMNDVSGAAHVAYTLGDVARLQGYQARAVALYEQSLRGLRQVGDKRCVASTLWNLGAAAQGQSEWAGAESLLTESLMLRNEMGDRAGIAESLEGLANLSITRGQAERAARLFGAAGALREATGSVRAAAELPDHERQVADLRAGLGDDAFEAAWAKGFADPEAVIAVTLEEPVPAK